MNGDVVPRCCQSVFICRLPVEVISIGAFWRVLISPLPKPAPARRMTSNKAGFRMAVPKVPQQALPAKSKALCARDPRSDVLKNWIENDRSTTRNDHGSRILSESQTSHLLIDST